MLSRREAVKLIGTGVCAGAAGVSGCLGDDTTLVSQGSSGRVNPEIRDDRLSRDGFDNYAEEMRGVYGDNGVWGREDEDGGAPESLGYVGAWTQDSEVANNSGRNDSAVAVYTTGRTVEMGGERYVSHVFWLWNAVRSELPEGTDGGVRRLSAGVSFDRGYEMGVYSPAEERRAPTYTPSLRLTDARTPSATVPLNGGTVAPVAGDTETGDGGGYRAEWRRESGAEVASVNAVFEALWHEDAAYDFDWENGYEATATTDGGGD